MTRSSVSHATFVIERRYAASPQRVFSAFADPALKAKWFAADDDWEHTAHELDFRVGGRETKRGGPKGGPIRAFEARYQDIVANERIVFTYDMHLDDQRISVSLTTVQFAPEGNQTRLTFTEQAAFLDGLDQPEQRKRGFASMLDALGAALEPKPLDT